MNISETNRLLSLPKINIRSSTIFGLIIFTALFAFELFNYSTTEFALHDLLGELRFAGIRWATILAIAFCGIDFAGIARLFTPKQEDEARETWYLFGAWLLAATMNAMLTWWGVSMAIVNHNIQSTSVVSAETVMKAVPLFVAVMVWLIRILIIGTISVAADHLMAGGPPERKYKRSSSNGRKKSSSRPVASPSQGILQPRPSLSKSAKPRSTASSTPRTEPTYHNASFDGTSSQRGSGSKDSSINRTF